MSGPRGERDLCKNKNPWQSPFKLIKKKINKHVNEKKSKLTKKSQLKKSKFKKKRIKKKKKKQSPPRFEPGENAVYQRSACKSITDERGRAGSGENDVCQKRKPFAEHDLCVTLQRAGNYLRLLSGVINSYVWMESLFTTIN